MIAELGHYAVCLAFAVALAQAANGLVPAFANARGATALAVRSAYAQFALSGAALAALVWLYGVSDFSVANVFENSHSAKPVAYRFAAAWGNHEGSMLLWVTILAAFGAALAFSRGPLTERLIARALGVQALIAGAFFAFILLTSNPFLRILPPPLEGRDLNPVLQDPGLIFHPPMLYVGYVGFSITFALACAALIEGRIDAAWGRLVRGWTLVAWIALTCGIALGSYWAYYELGWGGYWFWDPVENASLLPWLSGTALLHSSIVVERRESLKAWTVLLALLAFAMSLLGTFLVRSGVLTSVHAFANDPQRGLAILAIFAVFVGGSFALFAWRAPAFPPGGVFRTLSREGALVANNLLLTTAAAVVLVGTLYPIAISAFSSDLISVGPPYYNQTIGLLAAPLVALMPFGPRLAWKRADLAAAFKVLWLALVAAIAVTGAVAALSAGVSLAALLALAGGVWLVAGAASDIVARAAAGGTLGATALLRRLVRLPRAAFGGALAHAGLGVLLLGISISGAFKQEVLVVMQPGATVAVGPYALTLERIEQAPGSNYRAERAVFSAARGGTVRPVTSERRTYWTRGAGTTEVGLLSTGPSQLYVALGDPQGGGWGVRAYFNPFILFIWGGGLAMAAGGVLSLSDRRVRIGILGRTRSRSVPAAEPAPA